MFRCPAPDPDVSQQQKTGNWPIPKRTAQPLGWSDAQPCSRGGRLPKAQESHEEQWELWDGGLRPAEALRPHVERRCQGAGELTDTPVPKTGKEMVSAIVKLPEPRKRKAVQKLCPRPRTGGEAKALLSGTPGQPEPRGGPFVRALSSSPQGGSVGSVGKATAPEQCGSCFAGHWGGGSLRCRAAVSPAARSCTSGWRFSQRSAGRIRGAVTRVL